MKKQNFFDRVKSAVLPKPKFVYTTRNLGRSTANGVRIGDAGASGPNNSDFIDLNSIVTTSQWISSSPSEGGSISVSNSKSTTPKDERKVVEPKDVFEEIKRETPEISFDNLDEKIKVVEERVSVLKEHIEESRLTDEHRTLFYLKNRKKYLKTMAKNPLDWAMTSREAVDDLNKRYKLRTVPLQQYYTLVPKEGIAEMKRFTAAYKAITGDEPIYELVVKETVAAPEQKKKDRDPILLANSPLGNFLFIVGVWDDEVEIVDEIIYGFK